MEAMTDLDELMSWYASHCDGDWEHSYGVRIDTLDNPGWTVEIDLARTELEAKHFSKISEDFGDLGWTQIEIKDGVWSAACDHRGLTRVLRIFLDWGVRAGT